MLQELDYSARLLEKNFYNTQVRKEEVKRLKNQSNNFNSVLLVEQNKHILAYAPNTLKLNFNQAYSTIGIDGIRANLSHVDDISYTLVPPK